MTDFAKINALIKTVYYTMLLSIGPSGVCDGLTDEQAEIAVAYGARMWLKERTKNVSKE